MSFESFLWSVLWFVALIVLWPFAFLAAVVYVLISPFTACFGCGDLEDFLLKGVRFPYHFAKNMINGKKGC